MRYVLAAGQELEKIGYASFDPIGGRLFSNELEFLNQQTEPIIVRAFEGDSVSFDVDVKDSVYNVIAVPLPDADANVTEVLVVMKNITERKYAERNLVKAIEKERELGALKSRFVTMASHEFRTPLATMLSSVFLLQNYSGGEYETHKNLHLEKIRRSITTLTELMNDFLSIGSLEEGRVKAVYTQVDIGSLMKDIVADLQAIKKPGQKIVLELSDDEVTLMMDRQMLSSILRNLVSNAVKYSSGESEILISCTVENRHLIISVQDRGMGIPEHEQGEIFKRFYRAENAVNIQGTGLGLNIVWKYVKLLNGSIGFTSKINEGTTFTVKIPVTVHQVEIAN
jgi:signal transduction histidine kinase